MLANPPVHPRPANREYLRRLTTPALTPGGGRRRKRGSGVSLSVRNGWKNGHLRVQLDAAPLPSATTSARDLGSVRR